MFDPDVHELNSEGLEALDSIALLAVLRDTPTEELEATFRELDTLHNATGAHRLLVLAVLDEREVGRDDGALDTVGWVSWTARVTRARARALVETARALPERPEISTVALEGRLSDEQLEAVVQVATPETDAAWADESPGWTATSLRAAARNQRVVTADEAVARQQRREAELSMGREARGTAVLGPSPRRRWRAGRGRARHRRRRCRSGRERPVGALPGAVRRGVRCRTYRGPPGNQRRTRATVMVHTPEAALHEDSTEPGAYLDAGGHRHPARKRHRAASGV
jgi:hypothetical protein